MTTHSPATRPRSAILGQGYVGLPVSARAVSVGFDVVGFDLDAGRVAALARGESFIDDVDDRRARGHAGVRAVPPDRRLDRPRRIRRRRRVGADTPARRSTRPGAPSRTPPSCSRPYVRAGSCVILESTTYPGTTEELIGPLLQQGSGLEPGRDFHLGYSPERIDPGNPTWRFENTPKVVSGVDDASLDVVRWFYDQLVETTVPTPSPKEAEGSTKLLENTFRHVNIALVNELAMFAQDLGIDIWDVIDAAATKPFGYLRFTPGPGVGGHCLPVDPTTCRGRSGSGWAPASGSWSSPTTSTSTCPTTWCAGSATSSTPTARRSTGHASS